MEFRGWLEQSSEAAQITDNWPVQKWRYDMNDPEDRRRYEDDRKEAIASLMRVRAGRGEKAISERLVREPYMITCWRGFNRYSYDRDVSSDGGGMFISSERAMEGMLWFTHSLQSPSAFSGSEGPRGHALSYAEKYDEGYLLAYPLECERAYKSVIRDDGGELVEYADGLGPGWTKIQGKSYLLPAGWFVTWQNEMFMGFRGKLRIDESMLQRVS